MSVYRDSGHAIARIMSIETIDGTKKSSWQDQYQSGWPDGPQAANPCPLSTTERLAQDSMTRSGIHEGLDRVLWFTLVARYSINLVEVDEAVRYLIPRVVAPAHLLFKSKCVTAWAVPQKKGASNVKTSRRGLPDAFYLINTWDADGTPEGTLYRWKSICMKWINGNLSRAHREATAILEEKGLIERDAA